MAAFEELSDDVLYMIVCYVSREIRRHDWSLIEVVPQGSYPCSASLPAPVKTPQDSRRVHSRPGDYLDR